MVVPLGAVERAATRFMQALGLDTTSAGLRRTPRRVARADSRSRDEFLALTARAGAP
ncbi:hypothetical protein LQ327_21030 [Actinomycetospora endophytica]|uniref:Uncharacterized protein n=1 Tax=Actinomycetospora endophytica TaxID=2291215 RepID=A0ABS8PCH7_9PSEU|nr:hypothetical protein [Actinomycetospora endophytica]MCD2195859.1 hypothetical protein [Actinomycetospora endophytica]